MRIQVRLVNGATPEIRAITRELQNMSRSVAQANALMSKQAAASTRAMNGLAASTSRAGGAAGMGRFTRGISAGMAGLGKFGKNLQWTGRQIEYNFTLPLAIAAGFAMKWAMEQEKSFTHVTKVYGDQAAAVKYWEHTGLSAHASLAKAASVQKAELAALNDTFTILSSTMGVNKKEVNDIAGDWAAAGASGLQLAKSVQLTMQTMIIGDMGGAQASKALIGIQAQYGASTSKLTDIIATLNATENATGVDMKDLIDGFSRAAGSARTAGVTYRELAGMIAALSPATGSAANAGNALKTMFSRILAPTSNATQLLNLMHINVKSVGWESKTATQRLQLMAHATEHLTNNQKAVVSAYVASRYQVNRFAVLLPELISKTGYYARSLDATANKAKVAAIYQSELNAVLKSNPRQFDMVKESLRNMMVQAIIPFIPAIMAVAQWITKLAQGWSRLNPQIQMLIISGFAFIAVWGTAMRLIGALVLLFSTLLGPIRMVGMALYALPWLFLNILGPITGVMKALSIIVFNGMRAVVAWLLMPGIGARLSALWTGILGLASRAMLVLKGIMLRAIPFMFGPWGIAVAAIAAVLWTFRRNVGDAISWVIGAFDQLPQGVANAFRGVIQVLAGAINVVRDLLSHMNPFARHSPSLVDNVKAGTAVVADHYNKVAPHVEKSAKKIAAAKETIKPTGTTPAQQAAVLTGVIGSRSGQTVNSSGSGTTVTDTKSTTTQTRLNGAILRTTRSITAQTKTVSALQRAVDGSAAALQRQQDILARLQKVAEGYSKQLDAAKNALDGFTNAPLKGEKAMNQAILDNTVAQTKLNLKMMGITDAIGPIDKVRSRIDALHGDMELLTGEKSALRSAGAGSDITGVYDKQIKAIGKQVKSTQGQLLQYDALSAAMDRLQSQADRMNLVKSLKFDLVHQQIALLADDTKELTKGAIIAGIKKWQPEVNRLQAAFDGANKAVERQQAVVDKAQHAHDMLQRRLDAEKASLDKLTSSMSKYKQALSDANKHSAASKHKAKNPKVPKLSPAEQAFIDGGKGNFKTQNLGGGLGARTNWSSQAAQIKKFNQGLLDNATKSFGNLDIFAPLKDSWKHAVEWLQKNTSPGLRAWAGGLKKKLNSILVTAGIGATIGAYFGGPIGAAIGAVLGAALGSVLPKDFYPRVMGTIKSWGVGIGHAFAAIWSQVWKFVGPEVTRLWNEITGFFHDLGASLGRQWKKSFGKNFDFGEFLNIVKRFTSNLRLIIEAGIAVAMVAWKIGFNIFIDVLKPILDLVIVVITQGFRIVADVFKFFSDLFTGHWKNAWHDIQDILTAMWNILIGIIRAGIGVFLGVFQGLFHGIASFWDYLKKMVSMKVNDLVYSILLFFNLMLQFIMVPVKMIVNGIVKWFEHLYDKLVGHSIIPDLINKIVEVFHWLVSLPRWVFDHVVKPVINFFQKLFDGAINILSGLWGGIKAALRGLGNFGQWLWDHSLGAAWGMVKSLWTKHIQPFLGGLWAAFKWELSGLKNMGTWIYNHVIDPVVGFFRRFLGKGGTLRTLFHDAVGAIQTIWQKIEGFAKAPVKFIIDHVYMGGIRKVFDAIPFIGNLPVVDSSKMATGGVLPGYTPGRDVHKFYSATAGQLELSGGEAIMRPEWTKAIGGAQEVARQNALARSGKMHGPFNPLLDTHVQRHKGGGIFRPVTGGRLVQGIHDSYTGYPAIDLGVPTGTPVYAGTSGRVTVSKDLKGFESRIPVQNGYYSYGKYIVINGPRGINTLYAHLSKRGVGVGATVAGGERIGFSGNTGHSFGPHLHFGARGISPLDFLMGARGKGVARGGALGNGYDGISLRDAKGGLSGHGWLDSLRAMGKMGQWFAKPIGTLMSKAKDYAASAIKSAIKSAGNFLTGGSFLNGSVQDQVRSVANLRGWGHGAEWKALARLIQNESGWNPNAKNPGSSAAGLFQKMTNINGPLESTVQGQAKWGLKYIGDRYGDPISALQFWNRTDSRPYPGHWYKDGGVIPALRDGGIVRARAGGVLARIGEGGRDEAVTPLPQGWRNDKLTNDSRKTELHFHGDLSFPNITDPNDAGTLLKNLENLAKD